MGCYDGILQHEGYMHRKGCSLMQRMNLFKHFSKFSLNVKWMWLSALAHLFALLIAGMGLLWFDLTQEQITIDEETDILVHVVDHIISQNTKEHIIPLLADYLRILSDLSMVDRVLLYDEQGDLLYLIGKSHHAIPVKLTDLHTKQKMVPLQVNGESIGTLVIEPCDKYFWARIEKSAGFIAATLLLALSLAIMLSHRFKSLVLRPLHELAAVAKNISQHKQNSLAVIKRSDDEIGVLVDTFNNMFQKIQENEAYLKKEWLRAEQHAGELERYAAHMRLANEQLANENRIRVALEEERDRVKNFLLDIINAMPSVIVGVDSQLRITHWNEQAKQHTGVTPLHAIGESISTWLPEVVDYLPILLEALNEKEVRHIEKFKYFSNNEFRYFDLMIYPLKSQAGQGAVLRLEDVSTEVKLNEVVIQTEKMLSVGGLAAGMAHEINNPLSGIIQSAQAVMRRLSTELPKNNEVASELSLSLPDIRAYLKKRGVLDFLEGIHEAGDRASRIVKNMLQFSQKSDRKTRTANLQILVERTLRIAYNDPLFKSIRIEQIFDESLNKVPCIPSEMEQVLLNILRNAAQVLAESPEKKEKRITVRGYPIEDMARIEIEDTGPGMPEEIRNRVFEPFFTTKEVGKGTGLGMSISYFIVTTNHRGKITCKSEEGQGTTFVIDLPLAEVI